MAGNTNGWAPWALSQSTAALTITSMLAMPRLPAPTATVSPARIGTCAAPSVSRTVAGMSVTRGRANDCLTRTIRGSFDPAGAATAGTHGAPSQTCQSASAANLLPALTVGLVGT